MSRQKLRLNVNPYRGEWAALNPQAHQVVSHHVSLRAAQKASAEKSVVKPLLFPVPQSDAFFVGRA